MSDETVLRQQARTLIPVAVAGIVAVAVNLRALFNNQQHFLTAALLGSFAFLLLLPVVVAIVTSRTTAQAIDRSAPARPIWTYVALNLRRWRGLFAAGALIAIPVAVISDIYFQLWIHAVFDQLACADGICSSQNALSLDRLVQRQSILLLVVVIGLWGMSLLACVLTVRLTLLGKRGFPAALISVVIVIAVDFVMFVLLNGPSEPAPLTMIIVGLLPHGLTCAALLLFQRRNLTLNPRAEAAGRTSL